MAQVKKASSTSAWAVPVCVPAAPADAFCSAATMLAHIDVPRAPESGCKVLITALPEAESSAARQRIAQSVTVGIEAACPKAKNVYSTANKVLLISGVSHAMAETEPNIKMLPPKTGSAAPQRSSTRPADGVTKMPSMQPGSSRQPAVKASAPKTSWA